MESLKVYVYRLGGVIHDERDMSHRDMDMMSTKPSTCNLGTDSKGYLPVDSKPLDSYPSILVESDDDFVFKNTLPVKFMKNKHLFKPRISYPLILVESADFVTETTLKYMKNNKELYNWNFDLTILHIGPLKG